MQVLAEKLNDKGYDAKVVLFDANNMAAIAAKDGDIDGFMHNHLPWIKTFNEENNSHLIMPEPLLAYYRTAMYSTKYNSVDELPDNAKIGYPNDPTNVEKSLQMLERIGLIKLGEKQDVFYNALDIVENPKNIELVETEISTTARIINDVDTVICPATRILQAGLDPNAFIVEDEAAVDQAVSLTIDEKNSDQQWVKDAMELMHSDEMRATFDELFKGTIILYDK
ncbi:D-methionine transport system substrate-binding protein [Peptoclostridium litorale DSM 5388]|uniref:Putative D-methionine-binding lipoprotein MetQ n=1 Tax=Peptoclostridium litorale DSM 5388 TaxID=1121324 RepID=A0A069RH08_PEPLI|nr:MetQ/NlpA family ABC transporter substrate-binding protein [Peptoclostridium litorale]KDR96291.1 putative D-methionine-binding lipoprotein MetQ [Peptoclostridium litorale DSM 5388]SIO15339.1 D-methionine transport system substrate-binding protein [Peptoclostridium litorale DSM 5388]